MATFIKIFAIFWVIWILWYITGGPLRDDTTKPFVGPNEKGGLKAFGTSTLQK